MLFSQVIIHVTLSDTCTALSSVQVSLRMTLVQYSLYFIDQPCIKSTRINDLLHFTIFVAHVGQFILSGSKANGWDSQPDTRDRVRAEIPTITPARFASHGFTIGRHTSLSKCMLHINL